MLGIVPTFIPSTTFGGPGGNRVYFIINAPRPIEKMVGLCQVSLQVVGN